MNTEGSEESLLNLLMRRLLSIWTFREAPHQQSKGGDDRGRPEGILMNFGPCAATYWPDGPAISGQMGFMQKSGVPGASRSI